ncbi:MAG TPA: hypothetical protein VIA62_02545 [Thermoanaerobaculia bacterium]|jgi:hypothetical protein|nr:hypothetical protein [Thermoanaerobaculia bacterium]
MSEHPEAGRQFLRHTVATLAYRGGKALRDAPPSFAAFRVSEMSRTPLEILAHMGDLFDWACALAGGQHVWNDRPPGSWDEEVARFFAGLQRFDDTLAAETPLGFSIERLFQGPVADALTHVGQIAMLRRLAGAPVKGENFFKAEIQAGRVGSEQMPARREFD